MKTEIKSAMMDLAVILEGILKENSDSNKAAIEELGRKISNQKESMPKAHIDVPLNKPNEKQEVYENKKEEVAEKANPNTNKKKEEVGPKTIPHSDNIQEHTEEGKQENGKQKISWIGTSISKALNKEKVEQDVNVDIKMTRAYCIQEEENARFKNSNFKAIVPEVVKKECPDILVMQTGSIEITNIDVNAAMMDTSKDISEYKKEWIKKVEKDSINLLNIAQDTLEKNRKLKKVIIFKRLPRHDRSSSDLMGIKSELSKIGNAVYDLELTKRGNPENILVLDLDLVGSKHFRDVVYGAPSSQNYDGIHLSGKSANLHFTYRVVKALKTKVFKLTKLRKQSQTENHANCPQANYRKLHTSNQAHSNTGRGFNSRNFQSNKKKSYRSYSDAVSQGPTRNTHMGENIFNHLNF